MLKKSNNIQINDYITFNNQEVEGKYIKTKIISKVIYDPIKELIKNNNINQIYGDNLIKYKELLNLSDDFDLIYKEIIDFKIN